MSNKIEIIIPSPYAKKLQEYVRKKGLTAEVVAETAIKNYIEKRNKDNAGE